MPSTPRYQCTPRLLPVYSWSETSWNPPSCTFMATMRRDGDDQGDERDDQRQRVGDLAVQGAVEAEQAEDARADGRQQDQQRQEGNGVRHPHHVRLSMKAMSRAIPRAMPSA